ncbi:MAG: hypothetical protein P8N76_16210 [Pirellulaceae bacterium]|nr:hypothetical protein [Pirellulaceae bacterium]
MLANKTVTAFVAKPFGLLTLAAVSLVVIAGFVSAQEDVVLEDAGASVDSLEFSVSESCDGCGDADCGCSPHGWPRFGMYLKSGPSFQMGSSLFEEQTEVGYEVAFGGREPLLPTDLKVFFDFGGSYLSAFGEGRTRTVSGTFTPGTAQGTFLQDFYDMSLEEISRTSLHSAIGWYHELSHEPGISRLLTFRLGGRVSHIRGHFREDPTAALQNLIDSTTAQFTLAKSPLISQTDVSPGVFAGFELYSARYVARGVSVTFVTDAVLAADWINLEGYEKGTLSTANVLFGLSVNR